MTPTKITSASALRPSTLLGFGLAAGAVVAALAANPVQAYQATFNLQVANEASTSRTFIDATNDPGGWVNNTMVMTVQSLTAISGGTPANVTTNNSNGVGPNNAGYGLCVISTICLGSPKVATFSFTKPVQLGLYDNFRVGKNPTPAEWNNSSLGLYSYNGSSFDLVSSILLSSLNENSTFKFSSNLLVAANNAIAVGLICDGDCSGYSSKEFFISDVIVEAPAPLPLIGTGAAFAWTRRLRRRIKTTPVQSARS